jgi:hypothetical protein
VEDTVVIVLVGHGTFAAERGEVQPAGPDMAPQDFAPLLAKLKSKRVVFVNTASASGPFVEGCPGPDGSSSPLHGRATRNTPRCSAGRSWTRST